MKIGITSIFALLFVGCSLITPKEGVDPLKVERDIYNITKAATTLAISKIHEDEVDEQVRAAGKIVLNIDQFAMPILTNPNASVDKALAERLLTMVPEEYQGLMLAAYESFNTHYEFPLTSDILPEPHLSYLLAFLKGVRDGSEAILQKHNVTLQMSVEAIREE